MERDVVELQRRKPPGRVCTRCVERDVAEVEEPAVADDDVEPERHHRDDEDVDHRANPRNEVADEREVHEIVADERVDDPDRHEHDRGDATVLHSARVER